MRMLISGGAGFIGSHLARRCVEDGHQVTIVDNLSTGYRTNLPPAADFVHADLGNAVQYVKLRHLRPEVIFHIGGQSSAWISMDSALQDLEDNLRATILLSEWGLERGCRRFLYASSESVYGEGSATIPFSEDHLPRPSSYYGCSKLASEHYLRVSSKASGLEPTSLRLFTTYGPGQDLANARQGILSIYLSFVLRGEPVTIKGPLERVRDFVFVEDVVDAFLACAREPRTVGQELNVATGAPTRLGDLIGRLGKVVGGKDDYPVIQDEGTPGDVMASFGLARRLGELTGWRPTVSLDQGIAQIARAVGRS